MQEQQEAAMLQQQYDQQNTPEQIKARGSVATKDMKMRADIERDKVRESMRFALEMMKLKNQDEVNRAKTAIELSRQAQEETFARRQEAQRNMKPKPQGDKNDKYNK